MSDKDDGNNLPARGGEFVHSFSKESGAGGMGIVAVPFMIIAFLFFIVLAALMLAAGGFSLLLGKPAKMDFRYSLNRSRDIFGKKAYMGKPDGGNNGNVIDVEAVEISEKKIEDR
ncbi:MAG: hypothetical protein WCX65_00180 [bacterium]